MKYLRKTGDKLKYHLVDSTAIIVESTPGLAVFETGIAGMSDEVSISARIFAAGLVYLGIGSAFAKGRDLSRKLFKITDATKDRIQGLHDAAYSGAFTLVSAPLIYVASGARNINEIAIGTAVATGFGLVNGAPVGYAVDLFRDLTGLKDCDRPSYPALLKRQTPRTKKGLAALLTAGAMVLTAGIYSITPNKPAHYERPVIEQRVEVSEEYLMKN